MERGDFFHPAKNNEKGRRMEKESSKRQAHWQSSSFPELWRLSLSSPLGPRIISTSSRDFPLVFLYLAPPTLISHLKSISHSIAFFYLLPLWLLHVILDFSHKKSMRCHLFHMSKKQCSCLGQDFYCKKCNSVKWLKQLNQGTCSCQSYLQISHNLDPQKAQREPRKSFIAGNPFFRFPMSTVHLCKLQFPSFD